MKKKLILMFLFCATVLMAQAQSADAFIDDFKDFVTDVVDYDNDDLVGSTLTSIEKKYDGYVSKYNKVYKKKMTSKQIETFNKYRAKYQKKILTAKGKRKASAVSGWIKGVIGKDD